MRLRGDLPKWRASSLDWCANPSSSRDRGANPSGDRRECGRGANPPGDRRESGRPPTCSELACCGRRRPRVATRRRPAPCAELARCGRRRPRVAIDGSTPWAAASSCRHRWFKPGDHHVEEILFFEIASSSKSRSAAILLPFSVACSRCSRWGGAILFSTGYGRYRYPHPAQCEFAYPPRLHRLHNYTVLCRMDCCLSILHQWSQKKYSSGWRVGGCSLLDTTTKGRPVCRFHDV